MVVVLVIAVDVGVDNADNLDAWVFDVIVIGERDMLPTAAFCS